MSTELAILNIGNFHYLKPSKREKCTKLLEETRENVGHIKWCIEIIKINEMPRSNDINEVQKTIFETQRLIKKIKPTNSNQTRQLKNLKEDLDEASEELFSEYKTTLKKVVEILDNIFCCSSKYICVSQYDLDHPIKLGDYSSPYTLTSSQRIQDDKKNI